MKGRLTKAQRKEWFCAVIFLLPLTIGLLLFCVYPLVTGITYSFTDYNLFEMHFVGLENYKKVFFYLIFYMLSFFLSTSPSILYWRLSPRPC